jgi:NAD(P)-dependent dehydrogenase (short-subunit alcohol dehydrogenase family)
MNLFDHPYHALVFGASGAIGSAFVQALQNDSQCAQVQAVSRATHPQFDLEQPEQLHTLIESMRAHAPYSVIIDATGALTLGGVGPEKSLAALRPDQLARSMQVNAIGPLLLLRECAPLLASGNVIYAKLSARVGSISDNQLGGWYGYRAAKAALNMYLQTAAIELQRKNPQLRVVALQPGTVQSALSKPFATPSHTIAADVSVAGMLSALQQAPVVRGASFFDYQGQAITW